MPERAGGRRTKSRWGRTSALNTGAILLVGGLGSVFYLQPREPWALLAAAAGLILLWTTVERPSVWEELGPKGSLEKAPTWRRSLGLSLVLLALGAVITLLLQRRQIQGWVWFLSFILGALSLALAMGAGAPPPKKAARGKMSRGVRGSALFTSALVVLVLGLLVRSYRLLDIPQGMNIEEHQALALALPVAEGKFTPFYWNTPAYSGLTLYHHVLGWLMAALPLGDWLILRGFSIVGWLVLGVYSLLLSRSLFSGGAALGTAAYLSASFFALHFSRFGFFYIWSSAVTAGALAHALWSTKGNEAAPRHRAIAGIWCAVSAYGWVTGWLTPLLAALVVLKAGGPWRNPGVFLRKVLPGAAMTAALALPAAGAYLFSSDDFWSSFGSQRYPDSGFWFAGTPFMPPTDLTTNLRLYFSEMFVTGNRRAMHYLPGMPLFPLSLLPFLVLGLVRAFLHPSAPASLGLLLAAFFGFVPAWVAMPIEATGASFTRLAGLLLPAGLLFGAGWEALLIFFRRRLGSASLPLGLVLLFAALVREPYAYFNDYRRNLAAVKDNYGPESALGRIVSQGLRPGERLFLSEQYRKTGSVLFTLPKEAQIVPLREAPDWIMAVHGSPLGSFMTGGIWADWEDWTTKLSPHSRFRLVKSPWEGLFEPRVQDALADKRDLAVLFSWDEGLSHAGLKAQGDGWEAILWPPASHRYRLSVQGGRARFRNGLVVDEKAPLETPLDPRPYRLALEGRGGNPPDLRIESWTPDDWASLPLPLLSQIPPGGLKKTLVEPGRQHRPWVSFTPVLSQRFHQWSYEPQESSVGFPCDGLWEGSLQVPADGSYLFSVPNTFGGDCVLSLGGEEAYASEAGSPLREKTLKLKGGTSLELRLRGQKIMPDSELRFLVRVGGLEPRPVPSEWLRPPNGFLD